MYKIDINYILSPFFYTIISSNTNTQENINTMFWTSFKWWWKVMILIIDDSLSSKTKVLPNLAKHQRPGTDNIYLLVKDPFQS